MKERAAWSIDQAALVLPVINAVLVGQMTNDATVEPESDADERVLIAAGQLFREKGFAATTVREIAAASNMLPGSLHYRYASKDDILISLMRRGVRRVIAAVKTATATTTDPIEKLRLALRAHLEMLCSGDDSLYVLLFDWRSLPLGMRENIEHQRSRYETFWDTMLYEAHQSGRARQVLDLQLVRHFGFGALNWVATWYAPGAERTPAQIADALFGYLAFGLLDDAHRPSPTELNALFTRLLPGGEGT
jgi:TetR/AcrR family transcriptional regulator, cholesterol catabolism regulator